MYPDIMTYIQKEITKKENSMMSLFDGISSQEIDNVMLSVDWLAGNNSHSAALHYARNNDDVKRAKQNFLSKLINVNNDEMSGDFLIDIADTQASVRLMIRYNRVKVLPFKEFSVKRKSKAYPEGVKLTLSYVMEKVKPLIQQFDDECNFEANFRFKMFEVFSQVVDLQLLRSAIDYYRLKNIDDKIAFLTNMGFTGVELLRVDAYENKVYSVGTVDWKNRRVVVKSGSSDD